MIEPIFNLVSSKFDLESLDLYDLILEICPNTLKVLVKHDLLVTVYQEFNLENDAIRNIFSDHQFLGANFWKTISVRVDSPYLVHHSDLTEDPKIIEELHFETDLGLHYIKPESKNINLAVGIKPNLIVFLKTIYPRKPYILESSLHVISKYLLENNISGLIVLESGHYYIESDSLWEKILEDVNAINAKELYLFGNITAFHPLHLKLKAKGIKMNFAEINKNYIYSEDLSTLSEFKLAALLL